MNFRQVTENILGRPPAPSEGMIEVLIQTHETRLGLRLPQALRVFYATVGNLGLFTKGYHRFAKLENLQVSEGKLIFLAENQEVVHWAVDLQNGKVVYQTQAQSFDVDAEWYREDIELEPFLEAILYLQCLMADDTMHEQTNGGYEFFVTLDANEYQQNTIAINYLSQLEQQCTKVVDGNGLAIFWQPNTILQYFINAQGTPEETILACTKNEALFDQLIDHCGFTQL